MIKLILIGVLAMANNSTVVIGHSATSSSSGSIAVGRNAIVYHSKEQYIKLWDTFLYMRLVASTLIKDSKEAQKHFDTYFEMVQWGPEAYYDMVYYPEVQKFLGGEL